MIQGQKKVFRNNHDLPEGYEISYEQFHMTLLTIAAL